MFPKAESIGGSTLSLPFYPQLREKAVSRVIEAVQRVAGVGTREGLHFPNP
jgi:dTDP-4-amino-4,6-dideoxygalactose transaminase